MGSGGTATIVQSGGTNSPFEQPEYWQQQQRCWFIYPQRQRFACTELGRKRWRQRQRQHNAERRHELGGERLLVSRRFRRLIQRLVSPQWQRRCSPRLSELVGNHGSGNFTQTGGTNSVTSNVLALGENSGSSGTYNLNGGLLLPCSSGITVGSGSAAFNFGGGTPGR